MAINQYQAIEYARNKPLQNMAWPDSQIATLAGPDHKRRGTLVSPSPNPAVAIDRQTTIERPRVVQINSSRSANIDVVLTPLNAA